MSAYSIARCRLALAAVVVLVGAGVAGAQESSSRQGKSEGGEREGRVEGVVVKVERGSDGERDRLRLTINTAAIWNDYVRDTATVGGKSAEGAAEEGEDSIATKGQPRDVDTLVVVEVAEGTRMQLRHRAEQDSRTLGSATVEEARKPPTGEGSDEGDEDESPDLTGGRTLKPADLKVGQYVAVRSKKDGERQRAEWLVVLDPVREAK